MTRKKLNFLLLFCAMLSLVSISNVYSTHQLPIEKERITILCTYSQVGKNEYTANLKPNFIYNQSTLKRGEGLIYTKITESIETNFTYIFKISGLNHPANITINYGIDAIYASPLWEKRFNVVPMSAQNSTGSTAYLFNDYVVNLNEAEEIFEVIERETGTSTSTYNLTILPKIHTVAYTDVGTIDEHFNPSMTIQFIHYATEGDHITIDGFDYQRLDGLYENEKIYQPWIMTQRYYSYAYSLASFSALGLFSWLFIKNRPPRIRIKNPLDEIIKKYEEILFEISQEPSHEGQRVTMNTLEELIQLADGLGKPVFYSKKPGIDQNKEPTYSFYVLDGSIRYENTVTAPTVEMKAEQNNLFNDEDNNRVT